MKIWLDDLRPAPKEYIWCRSVNEAIRFIKSTDCAVSYTHLDVYKRQALKRLSHSADASQKTGCVGDV